jgi:hypothetical protein
MTEKRYTVFLSSTFRDLVEERQAALRAILALGHFPIGMEVFPATGNTPWELISRVIADADYYVLIIAGRYGSTTDEGISYTEREYEEAINRGKHVLVFLHENPDALPVNKSELSTKSRRRLGSFRKRVSDSHHCKFWKDSNELALQITQGLLNAFDMSPVAGWIRSGGPDTVALLTEMNELHQKIDALREENLRLREQLAASSHIRLKDFDSEEPLRLRFDFSGKEEPGEEIVLAWGITFNKFAPSLLEGVSAQGLRGILADCIVADLTVCQRFPEKVAEIEKHEHWIRDVMLTTACVQSVLLGLMARGLVINQKEWRTYTNPLAKSTHTRDITMWYLTPDGQRLYLSQGIAAE